MFPFLPDFLGLPCSDVKAIDAEDKQDLAAFPFDEQAEMAGLGDALPVGEEGFTSLERRYSNPYARLYWLACSCNCARATSQPSLQAVVKRW